MTPNEPLFLQPIFRSYLWGGTRLKDFLNKPVPSDGCWAESWEIVDHDQDQSRVVEGDWKDWTLRKLIETHPQSIIGPTATPQTRFPLLLKYLDCQRDLSVQVHPNDAYASQMRIPDLGKTEAWYVIDATDDAVVYAGLKNGVERDDLVVALENGRAADCLHAFHPSRGDCIFIPAGTVHALGSGLFVAEIQQASDTTFRLFDWNRLGPDGQPRPLQIEQALEVINFAIGPIDAVEPQLTSTQGQRLLVDCDRFCLLELNESTDLKSNGKFQLITVVQGTARILWPRGLRQLPLGQSVLLPADCDDITLDLSPASVVLLAK